MNIFRILNRLRATTYLSNAVRELSNVTVSYREGNDSRMECAYGYTLVENEEKEYDLYNLQAIEEGEKIPRLTICCNDNSLWLNFHLAEVHSAWVAYTFNASNSDLFRKGVMSVVPNERTFSIWYHIPLGNIWYPSNLVKVLDEIDHEATINELDLLIEQLIEREECICAEFKNPRMGPEAGEETVQ